MQYFLFWLLLGRMVVEDERAAVAMAVGDTIKRLRLEQGFTHYALASKIGMQAHQIADIERGEHCPRFDVLQKILKALGRRIIFVPIS